MTSWLAELPEDQYALELPPPSVQHFAQGSVVIATEWLQRIDAYECSVPTAPSPGRVYRRTYTNPAGERITYLFVVVDAPDGNGQLHVPCEVLP
jgi:hypothetical protein